MTGFPDGSLVRPDRRIAIAAGLVFLAVSLLFFVVGRGERSAYVLTFVSFPASFGLFGYNYGLGDQPMMAENTFYFDQTLLFSGAGSRLTLYFTSIRPLYAFIASLFAPIVGVVGSLALVNYLSWVLAALVTWRFTLRMFADELAAFIAVVLVSFGLGFAIHIHDYSPHIFPFALYYLGMLIVFESGVWRERQPWRTHLFIGTYFAVASLGYSTGIILAGAYVLVALPWNRWAHVAGALAIALSAQYAWAGALNLMNALTSGQWAWINVQQVEQDYMARSLAVWAANLSSPAGFAYRVWDGVLQFSNFECPLLVVAGLACWFTQVKSRSQRWFDVVFAGLPIAVGLVYLNYTTTRGYLIYGMSLLLYSTLAGSFATWLRAQGRMRLLGAAAVVLLVAAQVSWSTAYLWGYVVPAKMFFGFGYREWIPQYLGQWQLPLATSLTGSEPTPVMFGGGATLKDAGLFIVDHVQTPKFSLRFGLFCRALLVIYLAALAAAGLGVARRRFVAVAAVALWLLPVLVVQAWPIQPAAIFSTFDSEHLPAAQTWRYSVALGESFLSAVRQHQPEAASVEFMVAALQPPFGTRISNGEGVVLADAVDGRMVLRSGMDVGTVVQTLERSRRIEVELSAGEAGTKLFGWQRTGLPGRALSNAATAAPVDESALPAFEMRMMDGRGRPILIGY